jgi:cytochrome b6-f complex subunit 5
LNILWIAGLGNLGDPAHDSRVGGLHHAVSAYASKQQSSQEACFQAFCVVLEFLRSITVVEPLLSGIVLGLIPVTLAGLFVAAYLQYRRGNQFDL